MDLGGSIFDINFKFLRCLDLNFLFAIDSHSQARLALVPVGAPSFSFVCAILLF